MLLQQVRTDSPSNSEAGADEAETDEDEGVAGVGNEDEDEDYAASRLPLTPEQSWDNFEISTRTSFGTLLRGISVGSGGDDDDSGGEFNLFTSRGLLPGDSISGSANDESDGEEDAELQRINELRINA